MPIRWAIYHPQSSKQALLATETGIWTSSTLTQSAPFWVPANQGFANVRTDMLKIRTSDKKVVAASHGRGLFTGTFNYDFTSSAPVNQVGNADFRLWPNPGKGIFSIESPFTGDQQISLFTLTGQMIFSERFDPGTSGIHSLNLNSLAAGTYLMELSDGQSKSFKKVLIN